MDTNNNIQKAKSVPPFVRYCSAIIPTVFDDSLSYYEALCALWKWLQDNLVNVVNNNATVTEEYIRLTKELKEFVENYFANLDVQEEINNKLDDMVEAGTLQEIITSYIQSNVTWTFDTVADMKSATNLIAGSFAQTAGYYTVGDGGGAKYIIRDSEPSGFYETVGDLYAELILENDTIYTKQIGAIGDGVTDDTTKIKEIFDYVTDNQIEGFTVKVNGLHFVKPNELAISGVDIDNRLKSFHLIGDKDDVRSYLYIDTIENGFIFDTTGYTDIADFNNTIGVAFNYTQGVTIRNLLFTTNEDFVRGQVPLNAIELVRFNYSQFYRVKNNNFTRAYIGLYGLNGGGYVSDNNISLCNLGLRLSNSGDSTIEDNYINSIGYNIYDESGVLDARYTTLRSNNLLYAQGIYIGGSGNHTIKGGKIEWCAIGIWQDNATNMIYTGIQFDRCNVCGIALTGRNLINRATISNNNFTGCGGTTISSSNSDTHIGGIGRSCIGANNVTGILITGNKFYGDNGRLLGAFANNSLYYGPVFAVYFTGVSEAQITNNIINIDSQYAYSFSKSDVLLDANTTNKVWYGGSNFTVYRQLGNKRAFYNSNPSNLTFGNFDVGDMIYDLNNVTTSWRVSAKGTAQTISTTGSVVTVGTEFYPGDGSVIDFGTTYTEGIRTGAYINIAGVTGTKKIVNVIKIDNHYYAKLDSACDVAVLNAAITNQTPTFTSV